MVEEFMEANPDIHVEISYAHGSNYNDTLLALASSGDLPDVIQPTGNFSLIDLIENDWVQPLDDYVRDGFRDDFPDSAFAEGINIIGDDTYTFPRIVAKRGSALYYHTDLMEEAGLDPNAPPQTWDELLEMSKQITENVDGAYGFAVPLNEDFPHVILLAQAMQPTLDTNGFDHQKGAYDLDSPHVIEAMEFLLKMRDEGVIHPNSPTQELLDYQGLWANKQAAFGFNGHHFVRVNEFELDGVEDYNVAPIPVLEEEMQHSQLSLGADFNAYISSTTEHPEAAGKLIDWFSSQEFYERQQAEDLLLSPLDSNLDEIDNEQLKNLANVFEETVVARPVFEQDEAAFKVKQEEAALSEPQKFWQVVQGAYIGEIDDWQSELTKINDAYNERFQQAIENVQAEGENVSQDNFTFPDFDGTKDYLVE
nr:extracellular solute-binding protein [Gracilibacillus alcaliphilus]